MKNRGLGSTLGKRRIIRQGESSSSNPKTTVHRDAARVYRKRNVKNLAFNLSHSRSASNLGNTGDTITNIDSALHQNQDSKLLMPSAGVFMGLYPQPPILQKFINAVLDSTGDVLRERLPDDFAESFCAYFAALLPLLETSRDSITFLKKSTNEEKRMQSLFQICGIVYPLSAVTRHVPESILQRSWSVLAKLIHELLPLADVAVSGLQRPYEDNDSEHENSEEDVTVIAGSLLLRSLLSILSRLLYVRLSSPVTTDPEEWRLPHGTSANLFAALFHFVFNSKPRVRRIAHASVVRIVSQSHVLSIGVIAKQAHDLLFSAIKRSANGADTDEPMLRRCLSLAKDIALYLSFNNAKSLAEQLLSFTILGSQTVRLLAYSALAACCGVEDKTNEPVNKDLPSLAESLAAALMSDFRPPEIAVATAMPTALINIYCEWLKCVHVAHLSVLNHNPGKAISALPRLIEAIFNVFSAASSPVQVASNDANPISIERNKLALLTTDLLKTWIGVLSRLSREYQQNSIDMKNIQMAVHTITHILESALGFEHHDSWPQILRFISTVVGQLGPHFTHVLSMAKRLIPLLAELHLNASNRSTMTPEPAVLSLLGAIDDVFGASITAFGPQVVTDAVPLLDLPALTSLRESDVDAASWILSLLSRFAGNLCPETVTDSRLPFFIEKLLPLQDKLYKAMSANRASGLNEASVTLLYARVWSTLPAFCITSSPSSPIVIPPEFARLLGDRLTNDVTARPFIVNALRRFVENAPTQLSRYAKNFLPILFNLHVNQADTKNSMNADLPPSYNPVAAAGDDGLVLQTIRFWLTNPEAITKELAQHFLERTWTRVTDALGKLKSAGDASSMDVSEEDTARACNLPPLLLDLCIALMGHFSPRLNRNFISVSHQSTIIELLTASKFPTLQKRAYRLLEEAVENVIVKNHPNLLASEALTPDEQYRFVRDEVQPLLANALSKTSAPVRRARLACLLVFSKAALLTANGIDNNAFYSALLWEAVASLVDVNTRARVVASKLFSFICTALIYPNTALALCSGSEHVKKSEVANVDDDAIHCHLESLLRLLIDRLPSAAQWVASQQQQSTVDGCCAVLNALGKIFRHFRNPLIHEHIEIVLNCVEPLLSVNTSSSHRMIRCVLQLISSAISSLPPSELECILSRLVPVISGSALPECHRRALRTDMERLTIKLAKKCGLAMVVPCFSEVRLNEKGSDDKRLRHLFRIMKRSCSSSNGNRKAESANAESASEDEDPNERNSQARSRVKDGGVGGSFPNKGLNLIEDVDDIADTTQPSAALRHVAKQHAAKTMKMMSYERSKATTSSGKILIKQPRTSRNEKDDESDDYVNGVGSGSDDDSDFGEKHTVGRKRTKSMESSKKSAKSKKTTPVPKKSDAKKGPKMQPYIYKPLRRNILNKRRAAQYRAKERK